MEENKEEEEQESCVHRTSKTKSAHFFAKHETPFFVLHDLLLLPFFFRWHNARYTKEFNSL